MGWDHSLAPAPAIYDQGDYPYCVAYSVTTLLEHWGKSNHPEQTLPPLDYSFLAAGHNYEVGGGGEGMHSDHVHYVAAKYGVIPQGSVLEGDPIPNWGPKNWQNTNLSLVDKTTLERILNGVYRHPSVDKPFTAKEYYRDHIGLDFGDLEYFCSDHIEKYQASPASSAKSPAPLRAPTAAAINKVMEMKTSALGWQSGCQRKDPNYLYDRVVGQIDRGFPAGLVIHTRVVATPASKYKLLNSADLEGEGKFFSSRHAVVGVGYCDKWKTENPLCSRFVKEMENDNVRECIVVQNSWGTDSHDAGYLCISRNAFQRVALEVRVSK